MYDAIVVGARCAGSPLAMLLARKGAKVLLVDRATFPSNIPHGHFIHRHGPQRLKRWGLLERISQSTPPITTQLTDFGDFPLLAEELSLDDIAWGYGPRRVVLDKILVEAAVESGAELREGFAIDDFLFENGRLVGVRGHARNGRRVEEKATITIGADGRNSRLARAVHAPAYDTTPPLLFYYFSYWSGVESKGFELYIRNTYRRVVFAHRSSDNLFVTFVGWPMEELQSVKQDIEQSFLETVDSIPDFAARLRAGHREERFYGATDLPNFYRKPYGPGWALVGDAGCHKAPYLALGICDALRDVEFLAEAIGVGLTSPCPLDEALAAYERRRNAASAADYQQNVSAARFQPFPDDVLRLRAAIKGNPEETRRWAMARAGMIDPQECFNPENIQRLLS